MSPIPTRRLTCLAGVLLSVPAAAQWSSDPAENLAIADLPVQDEQPKVVATADGGCYVSWFSDAGFDVRLQRLDASGVEQWAHNGILVADRAFSSTQDYQMDVDDAGNAVLAFRDDRFGGTRVTAQMVAPDGGTPWGANGVQFDDGTAFIGAPKIAAATDGAIFVAWSRENETRIHKLEADGTLAWPSATILPNAEPTTIMSDMNASDDGAVIVSCVAYVTFTGAKHLYAQKVDADGAAVWSDWVSVMDDNSLQFGNFPAFVPDGAGGAVFSWYTTGGGLQSWVQRVLADGTEVFPDNGLAVSTGGADRVSPSAAFDPATGETYVFWQEEPGAQYAVYGQKISADGARQWGDGGVAVTPVSSNVITSVRTIVGGCGAMVFYDESLAFGDDRVRGSRVDVDGNAQWKPAIVTAASRATGKSRLVAARATDGGALLAWVDAGSGTDVYAQRVNLDGTLGLPPAAGDATGDGVVDTEDLLAVLSSWWGCCGCPADLNDDGVVDTIDLLIVLANWT
jgi:hypothetical protein